MDFVSRLTDAQMRNVFEQHHKLWGGSTPPEERYQTKAKNFIDSFGYDHFSMCGFVDDTGRVVSSLKKYRLHLMWNKVELPVLGIGAVFTHPEFRRQGFAGKMLEHVMASLSQDRFDAALLFSDISTAYYEQFGFQSLPSREFRCSTSELPSQALKTRAVEPKDEGNMRRWYASSLDASRPYLSRSGVDWELFRRLNTPGEVEQIVLKNEEAVGYVRAFPDESSLMLEEAAGELSQSEILSVLRAVAMERNLDVVEGWCEHPSFEGVGEITARKTAVVMVAGIVGVDSLQYTPIDHF